MKLIILILIVCACVDAKLPDGGAQCTMSADCGVPYAGICENNTCVCSYKYTDVACTYARKSATNAFVLDLVLGFLGQIYIENYPSALILIILETSAVLVYTRNRNVLIGLISLVMWIMNLVKIIADVQTDGNGESLYK